MLAHFATWKRRAVLEKHELNRSFEWIDRVGPFRLINDEQAKSYNEKGYFILEDAVDPDTVAQLLAEMDPVEKSFAQLLRDKFQGKMFIARADEITFTPHLVTRSEAAKAFTRSKLFADLVHDLLGPDVRLYWDQAVYKKPKTPNEFPWHQDNGYTYVNPQQYLTCWVALTDADEENGCPYVMPGVHRQGTLAHQTTDLGFECAKDSDGEAIAAPVRAGSIVVFSSLTPHKTGPNVTSDRLRKTYIVQFAPDGAQILKKVGDEIIGTPCDAADRQYPVLVNGEIPG